MKRDVSLIILYNEKNQILLQHRDDDTPRLPGYWAFFGGGIDEGEDHYAAVIRETKEELQYDLEDPQFLFKHSFEGGNKYVYLEKYNSAKEIIQCEGQGMQWCSIEKARTLGMVDHDLAVLDPIEICLKNRN